MKRYILLLFSLLLVFMSIATPLTSLAAGGLSDETLYLANEYIKINIHAGNGRFAARTVQGDPSKSIDDNTPILYEKDIPETSFTSFLIGEEEVIFGNRYLDARFIQPPKIEGNKVTAIWRYKDVEITQTIELIAGNVDISTGNALISYSIKNESTNSVQIGSRLLYDVSTGGNDGAYIMKAGEPIFLKGERLIEGEGIPLYWTAVDNLENPVAASYGTLYGWGEEKPSKLIFGHWAGLSSTKYTYTPDEWLDYTVEENIYGTADSAVAVYWENITIAPQQRKSVSTLLGMGDIAQKQTVEGKMGIHLSSPNKVVLTEGVNTTLEVAVEIDNAYPSSDTLEDVQIAIGYPPELKMTSTNQNITLQTLQKGSKLPVKWSFKPNKIDPVNIYPFTIHVNKSGTTVKRETVYVVALSSFAGTPPEIEYHSVTPKQMYYAETFPKVTILGSNLRYLSDNPNKWDVYLKNPQGEKVSIAKEDVSVMSNNEIEIFLPGNLPVGSYGIGIEHQLEGKGFYRDNALTLSDDTRLLKRAFGTLLITKKETEIPGTNANTFTHIENNMYYFKGNTPVVVPQGEKEVIRIAGNIQEMVTGKEYSIIPTPQSATYFGKVLKVTGAEGAKGGKLAEIKVKYEYVSLFGDGYASEQPARGYEQYEKQRHVMITGNAQSQMYLEIPKLILGVKEYPTSASKPLVWSGEFELNVNDFVIKNPKLLGTNVIANIAGYVLNVKELTVVYLEAEKQYAVDIKAGLDLGSVLGFLYKHLSTNKKTKYLAFVDAQVEKFRILEDGRIRFKSEFAVGLPQLRIGALSSTGNTNQMGSIYGRLFIDTIDDLYGIEAQIGLPDLAGFGDMAPEGKTTSKIYGKILVFAIPTGAMPILLPDTVLVEFNDDFGFIQIPEIPFAINQIGGGIQGLHTLRDAANTYPDFSGHFKFGITDTVTPLLFGSRMFSLTDMTISVGSKEMSLSGKAKVYFVPLLEAEAAFMYYPKIGARVSGGINIFDIVVGKVAAEVSYNYKLNYFYAGGRIYGYIQIPNEIPIIGGVKLADVLAGISTEEIRAYAAVPILDVYAGFSYRWGDWGPTVYLAGTPEMSDIFDQLPFGNADALAGGQLFVGTNFYPLTMSDEEIAILKNTSVSTMDMSVTDNVYRERDFYSDGKDAILIQATYDKGKNPFPMKLIDPNNKEYVYPEFDENKFLKGEFDPDPDDDTNALQDYVAFSIPAEDNVAGYWQIQYSTDLKLQGFGVLPLSTIKEVTVQPQADLKYDVSIETDALFTDRFRYTADLYLETKVEADTQIINNGEQELPLVADGLTIELAKDVEITASETTVTVELPDRIASGDYTIRVELRQYDDEGKEMLFDAKSSTAFSVTNTHIPSAPQHVTVAPAGNGLLKVEWDKVNFANITGYYVLEVDASGNLVPDTTPIWVPNEADQERYTVTFGGYTTGATHYIAVQAVSETKPDDDGRDDESGDRLLPVSSESTWLERDVIRDKYIAMWEPLPGVSEYMLTLSDELGAKEDIMIPYYDDGTSNRVTIEVFSDGEEREVLAITQSFKNIENGYNKLTVVGIEREDLQAKNVVATPRANSETKIHWENEEVETISTTVTWDKVDAKNIQSYTIYAVPADSKEESIVTYEHRDISDPQLDTYSVTIDGLKKHVNYQFSVVANKKQSIPAEKYYGAISDGTQIYLPEPAPPVYKLSVSANDEKKRAAVQLIQENGMETLLINSNEILLRFQSQDAARTELYVNSDPLGDESPYKTYGAQSWSEMLQLPEGANDIRIVTYNAANDVSIRSYQIAIKTSLPALMVDSSLTADQLVIAGITDSGSQLFINADPVLVAEDGSFTYSEPVVNKMSVPFKITAIDVYGNENTYIGEAIRKDMQQIRGIEIQLEKGEMVEGEAQRLRLFAKDANGKRTQLSDDAVTWSVLQDYPSVEITDGYLTAVGPGQSVITASFQANESYTWQDAAVVNVDKNNQAVAMFHAYLTNVLLSGGEALPAFDKDIREYRIMIPYSVTDISLRPQTDLEQLKSIEVNGEVVENGESSVNIPLEIGNNTITIHVTAHGMFDNTYTFHVVRLVDNVIVQPDIPVPAPRPRPILEEPKVELEQPDKPTSPEENKDPIQRNFADTVNHWALESIMKLVASGAITGYPDGNFRPDNNISRAEFTTILVRAMRLTTTTGKAFADTSKHWAKDYIAAAAAHGIVSGYDEHHFGPNEGITREQMAVMLVKGLKLELMSSELPFTDSEGISPWARDYVATAVAHGLLKGYPNRSFNPKGLATRGEAATVLVQLLK